MRKMVWAIPAFAAATAFGMALLQDDTTAAALRADPDAILHDPTLRSPVLADGKVVYAEHCASCHGPAGKGDPGLGAPDLTDLDRLYGDGTVSQIEDIARYGIRAGNKRGWNLAIMPSYAARVPDAAEALPPQKPAAIADLTQFMLSYTARATDQAAVERGKIAYTTAGCWDCHGRDLAGDPAIGAPSLTDDVWLYGGRADDIRRSIANGRAGRSPAFARTLTPAQLRTVAVYVASLSQTGPEKK